MISLNALVSSSCCLARAIPTREHNPDYYICGNCFQVTTPIPCLPTTQDNFYTIPQAAELIGRSVGATKCAIFYDRLKVIRIGKRTIVPKDALEEFRRLPDGRVDGLEKAREVLAKKRGMQKKYEDTKKVKTALDRLKSMVESAEPLPVDSQKLTTRD